MKYKVIPGIEDSCEGCSNNGNRKMSCYIFNRARREEGLPDCRHEDIIYTTDIKQPNFLYDNLGEKIETN